MLPRQTRQLLRAFAFLISLISIPSYADVFLVDWCDIYACASTTGPDVGATVTEIVIKGGAGAPASNAVAIDIPTAGGTGYVPAGWTVSNSICVR